jgi:glycosyltransferase involved in cell wall biosynthesis
MNRNGGIAIMQVSMADVAGGAESVAFNLFRKYSERGNRSVLAVGYKNGEHRGVMHLDNDRFRGVWARSFARAARLVGDFGKGRAGTETFRRIIYGIGQPRRVIDIMRGGEHFDFPGTWRLFNLSVGQTDVVHCHNLHGGYFDLRILPSLSKRFPLMLTLHDAWLLAGHCAHSFDCNRWETGCGECPDLTISPPVRRDQTAYNWGKKREIFLRSRLYVATPSQWLMKRAERSILAPAVVESRVIPNGIDLSIFRPNDKELSRQAIGIQNNDVRLVLFTANGIRHNMWKDYPTLRAAIKVIAAKKRSKRIMFLALGEEGPDENVHDTLVKFIPYEINQGRVAQYFQAADIYVHPARADTFPTSVLEALACGAPVVATAVGGIPEQIDEGVTGYLVKPGDAEIMAGRIQQLLDDDGLRTRMGLEAAKHARRWDIERQVDAYLTWYHTILESWNSN